MHPLDGPRRNIDRAANHIKELELAVGRWYKSDPFPIIAEQFNADRTGYIYRFEFKAVPLDIGIIAGDIVHNLRCALDYIAWYFASNNRNRVGWRKNWECDVMFPILLDNADGKKFKTFERLLKYFPEDARKVVDTLQPYHTPQPMEKDRHPLWCLNRLSNIDTHQTVPIRGAGVQIQMTPGTREDRVNDYTIDYTVPTLSKTLIPLPPQFSYHVSFGIPDFPYDIQVGDFSKIHSFIANKVIPSFNGLVPKSVPNRPQKI